MDWKSKKSRQIKGNFAVFIESLGILTCFAGKPPVKLKLKICIVNKLLRIFRGATEAKSEIRIDFSAFDVGFLNAIQIMKFNAPVKDPDVI